MMRATLKIAGGTLLFILFGAVLFVGLDGKEAWASFIYNKFNPTSEQLIGKQKVPHELSVTEWRRDLDSLATAIRSRHPNSHVEAAYGTNRLARRVDSLQRLLPQQTRDQRILSVFRLMNFPAPGTGHSGIFPAQRAINWGIMPIQLFEFADGYHVVDAMDETIIGHEVLAVGGVPIDSVAAALAPYVSGDNRWKRRLRLGTLLLFADPLRAIGIVDQTEYIPVRMQAPDGEVLTRTVEPGDIYSPSTLSYAQSLEAPVTNEWSPAHLHPRRKNYHFSYRDSTDLLYLQFNDIRDASGDWTIADLADSLRYIADTRPLDKVVVDIRNNRGGNTVRVQPLIELFESHPKIDQRGVLYTLTSRKTFSAAGTLALEMERRTKTIFAGEPGGFAPSSWGDVPYLLPNSKITVDLQEHYYQKDLPDSPRMHLEPDLHVPLTARQHFSDIDSTMIAVRQHEPDSRESVSLTDAEREPYIGTYRLSPIHRVQVTDTSEGFQLRVKRERPVLHPFIKSDLHPLSPTRLATDITAVYLERRPDSRTLSLVWKDTTYALTPVDSTFTLPIEDLWAGRFEQAARRLRAAHASGFLLDKWIRRELTIRADTLEERGRPSDALQPARLAAELFPHSSWAYYRLGYTYESLGRVEEATRAYRMVRMLAPRRADAVNELLRELRQDEQESGTFSSRRPGSQYVQHNPALLPTTGGG